MECSNCNNQIDEERLELLPRTKICSECAQQIPFTPMKGAMIFDHKTGGQLQVMGDKEYELYSKTFRRVGQQSILRPVSPSKN